MKRLYSTIATGLMAALFATNVSAGAGSYTSGTIREGKKYISKNPSSVKLSDYSNSNLMSLIDTNGDRKFNEDDAYHADVVLPQLMQLGEDGPYNDVISNPFMAAAVLYSMKKAGITSKTSSNSNSSSKYDDDYSNNKEAMLYGQSSSSKSNNNTSTPQKSFEDVFTDAVILASKSQASNFYVVKLKPNEKKALKTTADDYYAVQSQGAILDFVAKQPGMAREKLEPACTKRRLENQDGYYFIEDSKLRNDYKEFLSIYNLVNNSLVNGGVKSEIPINNSVPQYLASNNNMINDDPVVDRVGPSLFKYSMNKVGEKVAGKVPGYLEQKANANNNQQNNGILNAPLGGYGNNNNGNNQGAVTQNQTQTKKPNVVKKTTKTTKKSTTKAPAARSDGRRVRR